MSANNSVGQNSGDRSQNSELGHVADKRDNSIEISINGQKLHDCSEFFGFAAYFLLWM